MAILTQLGTWTARPSAFLIVGIYALGWVYCAPEEMNWHGIATLATWLMTLVIQRAEHRDTQAIHAKLDELLRTDVNASNAVTRIDRAEPEEIEQIRSDKGA